MKKVKLAVIGAGNVGRIHVENIVNKLDNAELVAVSDFYPEKYNEIASEKGWPLARKEYREILKDEEVDAVVIATPAALHGDMIIESAKAGKDVFCEKPLDYDKEKIVEVMKIVEETGIKLQIGFNRRFDKNFMKAKELVETGKLGDIHVIKITSRDPSPPGMEYFTAPGGEHCSIYTDTTIHDFDMVRFFNPAEVVEVYAMGSKLINKDVEEITRDDTCVITLRFEDDSLAVIDNSWEAVYGYDQRSEVFGTKGAVTVENDVFSETTLHATEGIISEKPLVTIKDRYGESYANEIKAFVDAIQNDAKVPVDAYDGLISIVIADAARLSAEENRPIKIKELMPEM